MEEFIVELAGLPIKVRCRFESNKLFLQDYISEKEPLFTIEPSIDDLKKMQAELNQMAIAEGLKQNSYSKDFIENNAIHGLIAEKLVEHNVLLMHGSALCMDGQAFVFIARSGTGKSTHARLWREVFGNRVWMINDDKPLLRIENDCIRVYGSPWNGKHQLSRNAFAPLKAIIWLNRDEINYIEPMTKAEAFPVIMEHSLSLKHHRIMSKIIELEKIIIDSANFYKLGCNQELSAAKVAYEKVKGERLTVSDSL